MAGIIMIIFGLFLIFCTIKRPDFFWNHRKAQLAKKLLGDTITSILYIGVGTISFAFGLAYLFI